ncbi:MAG: O-antigen ligase family protein, partial [Chloroflexota bacterium]
VIAFATAMVGLYPAFNFDVRGYGPLRLQVYWVHLAIGLLLLVTVIRLIEDGTYLRHFMTTARTALRGSGLLWLLLALWTFASIFWAYTSTGDAVYATVLMSLELVSAFVIAVAIARGGMPWLGAVFLFAALPHALLGIVQGFTGAPVGLYAIGERYFNPENPFGFGPQSFRPYGLSFHPNILAGHMGMTLLIGMVTAYSARNNRRLLIPVAVGLFVVFVALLMTLSRVALVITMAVFAPMTLYAFRPRGRALIAVGGVVVLGIISVIVVGFTTPLIQDLYDRFYMMLGDPQASLARIMEGVPNTLAVWQLNPVAGVGGYNLQPTMVDTQPLDRNNLFLPAHNIYLIVLAELGVVGMMLYTAGLLVPLRNLFSSDRTLVLTAAAVLGFALLILFDFYYWWPPAMRPTMYWLLGMVWGLRAREVVAQMVPEPVAEEEPENAPVVAT